MIETLITGFIGGVCAWFLTDFVAKPFRRFYDLRHEVTRCLVVYGNVSARSAIDQAGLRKAIDLSPEEDARLVEAQDAFRDLAGKMRAFANVDRIANWGVSRLGYDADKIATALIGYSNQIATFGQHRADAHDRVQKLLRVKSEST